MDISSNNEHDHAGDDQPFRQDNKSLLRSEALYKYILETSVYPREPEALRELRLITAKHPRNLMAAAADEVQFLGMLLRLINAKRTLEIGVFTGYSLLATALALPEDGTILAIDIDRKSYELGLPVIEKAGVAHKIDFREGKALAILDELMNEEKYRGWFDFVFVDADKVNYLNYHERVMELVKVGGVIGYDNTLWYGSVAAAPDEQLPEFTKKSKDDVIELNKALAADQRIEITGPRYWAKWALKASERGEQTLLNTLHTLSKTLVAVSNCTGFVFLPFYLTILISHEIYLFFILLIRCLFFSSC